MVWKPKMSRRSGGRSAVSPGENGSGSRQIRSCLKVGPDEKLFVDESQTRLRGQIVSDRDHSFGSGRSSLSVKSGSGSSRSRDSHLSIDRASGASGASADSAISARNSHERSSQHSPIVSRVPVEDKSVRFGNVSIREHERAVGDNPSCSTGPPIGIGWRHGDTKVMPLDSFEDTRRNSHRKRRIVLTRAEREELLLNWGFPFDDIIDSIRANIKVKNQRRQTITNLRVERLEEAFENATRRIKRALLLRSSTTEKAKRLQQQAEVAAKIAPSPSSSVSDEQKANETSIGQRKTKIEREVEEDRNQVSLPDFRKKLLSESRLVRSASSLSDIDDPHPSISGGFSLGNSTTASAREMERFYMELEMEMFGDIPLPDMVGETLEVPGLSIPEEERVYHDPPCTRGYQEPPSITPSYGEMLEESKAYKVVGSTLQYSQASPRTPLQLDLRQQPSRDESDGNSPPIRKGYNYLADSDPASLSSQMPIPPGGYIFHDDPITAIRMGHAAPPLDFGGLGEEVDLEKVKQQRAKMVRAYLSQTVTAMEQRYLHPSLAPPPPKTNEFGMPMYTAEQNPQREKSSHSSGSRSGSTGSKDSRRRSKGRKDGPVVCHTPPFTKMSPTHWMEGRDGSDGPGFQPPLQEPITISEDFAYDDRIRPSSVPALDQQPVYMAPQRFPGSVYT